MIRTIKDIAPNTVIVFCGTLSQENDLDKLNSVMAHNSKLLSNFKGGIIVLNKDVSTPYKLLQQACSIMYSSFGFTVITDHINRGYQLGFVDEDLLGFNFCKYNIDYDFYLKINIDTLLFPEFNEIQVDDSADIIYMPELTSLDPNLHNVDGLKKLKESTMSYKIEEDGKFSGAWPMPWLYMLSKKVSDLYDGKENLENIQYRWMSSVNGDSSKWHEQNKFICSEEMLVKSFINREYTKYCFVRGKDLDDYCKFITDYNVKDATIKNVHLKKHGICHLHWKKEKVLAV